MAFYGLNFGEKAMKHHEMKPRDSNNRSFVPVRAPRSTAHIDPIASRPLSSRDVERSIANYQAPDANNAARALPQIMATSAAGPSQALNPPSKPKREVALVFQLPSAHTEREVFDRVDNNGNGMLSLAELDKAVVELWPRFNNKPAILRAYKAADANGTGFISRKEFSLFLRFLVRFTELWCLFQQLDENGDRRLSFQEFERGSSLAGFNLGHMELLRLFEQMDTNKAGYVLFDEFCHYFAEEEIKEQRAALKIVKQKAKPKKIEFLDLPNVKDTRKLFDQIDVNRNGVLSLAELDKAVVELWPRFNNKPALMRAYKAADLSGNGLLGRKEFSAFLQFLAVYQNLFQRFEFFDENGDRRLSREEFLKHASKVEPFNSKTRSELERVFDKLDVNGGGFVLFDEFCNFAAADVLAEFIRSQKTQQKEAASRSGEKGVKSEVPTFEVPPCSLMCHICGKRPAEHKSHLKACAQDFADRVKLLPSFLQRPVPVLTTPLPVDASDIARYNKSAEIIFESLSQFRCPECEKLFSVSQFHGHFKTHKISYNRKMELEKLSSLQRPNPRQIILPEPPKVVNPKDVVLDIKLQCVSPFDLTKLNALRRQLYVTRVRSAMVTLDELMTLFRTSGVSLEKEKVLALLGGERGSLANIMSAIDSAGCSAARHEMIRSEFQRWDTEGQESVEYRVLRRCVPSEGLREMFARPLEKHVSAREFENVLADLSVLYEQDGVFKCLFVAPEVVSTSTSETCRVRVTLISGEIKLVEISAPTTMKLDKISLKRRLALLGITDVQRLEVVDTPSMMR